MYLKELKTGSQGGICAPVLIAHKCPLTDEWMHRMGPIHTVRYDPTLAKKNILTHATVWMKLKDIKLSEISRSQKRQRGI